jgi:AraC-like DNA-binding protein
MVNKKPTFEKVSPSFGSSILLKQHTNKIANNGASWHFHPELELVYVNKGQGKRHIGNHLSYFKNSQLVLLGSNLPHYGFTDRLTSEGSETLVQFKQDFLGVSFFEKPEMQKIVQLFERSKKGILFKPKIKMLIGPKIEQLVNFNGLERIIKLLEILSELANSEDYSLLNADGYAFETKPQDSERIDIIYRHISNNFKNHISLDHISEMVSMTVPAFCRYFKKVTGKTFTKLVNEYRVVHATKLLSESQMTITDICFESGFNNFSHFSKLFKEFTGKSAMKYRNDMNQMIQ